MGVCDEWCVGSFRYELVETEEEEWAEKQEACIAIPLVERTERCSRTSLVSGRGPLDGRVLENIFQKKETVCPRKKSWDSGGRIWQKRRESINKRIKDSNEGPKRSGQS